MIFSKKNLEAYFSMTGLSPRCLMRKLWGRLRDQSRPISGKRAIRRNASCPFIATSTKRYLEPDSNAGFTRGFCPISEQLDPAERHETGEVAPIDRFQIVRQQV